MEAFHFGAPGRRLFGCFHAATAGPARQAVLICGPYGQELVRAHRMLRVLAERLARQACDVLRFDPYGSGDSAGHDEELDWPGWVADVQAAAAELRARSRATQQVWIGARLGASVACEAASRVNPPPAALVLCEPVLDGPEYLHSLALATVEALEASCSIRDPAWRRSLQSDPQRWEREAVGFAMGEPLHARLRGFSAASLPMSARRPVWMLSSGTAPRYGEQAARWREQGIPAHHEALPFAFDWTAEEALNTALVPHEMLQRLVDLASAALQGPR